jgi:hypothetical protein
MTLCDELRSSGRKWAAAALEAYGADKPDHDFAVHHMAVAVEHISKAYLCSITAVLLIGDRPNVEDLLILAGHGDRTNRQYADIKTIGGSDAIARAERLLGKQPSDPESLRQLRETRNGITHLAQGASPSQFRRLLAVGIDFINALLSEMKYSPASFWEDHETLATRIAVQAVTDLQLRYENKVRRAQHYFDQRFGAMREPERSQAIAALSSVPFLTHWGMVSPEKCPACGSPAMMSGRDYDDGDGPYFAPRFFGCRVCDLKLRGDELRQAGFKPSSILNDSEEYSESDYGEEEPAGSP